MTACYFLINNSFLDLNELIRNSQEKKIKNNKRNILSLRVATRKGFKINKCYTYKKINNNAFSLDCEFQQ